MAKPPKILQKIGMKYTNGWTDLVAVILLIAIIIYAVVITN